MTSSDSTSFNRYALREGPDFLQQVNDVIGDVQRWDEIRRVLDEWLRDRPRSLPECAPLPQNHNLWFVKIASIPPIYLLYKIDDERLEVTYESIRALADRDSYLGIDINLDF